METAITGGDSPFEFSARPELERAIMTAHHRERAMRKAHMDKVQRDISDKNSKKGDAAPTHDPHAGFFDGLA